MVLARGMKTQLFFLSPVVSRICKLFIISWIFDLASYVLTDCVVSLSLSLMAGVLQGLPVRVIQEVLNSSPAVVKRGLTRENIKWMQLPLSWPFLYSITAHLRQAELRSTFPLFLRCLSSHSPLIVSVLIRNDWLTDALRHLVTAGENAWRQCTDD